MQIEYVSFCETIRKEKKYVEYIYPNHSLKITKTSQSSVTARNLETMFELRHLMRGHDITLNNCPNK